MPDADHTAQKRARIGPSVYVVYGRDYLACQSDYAEKVLAAARLMKENGYEYFFLEEKSLGNDRPDFSRCR